MQTPVLSMVEIIGIISIVIIVVLGTIYWFKFDRPQRQARELLRGLIYEPAKFRKRAVAQTFKYYDEKIGKVISAFVIPSAISIIIPAFVIPAPFNFVITLAGCLISCVLVMYYKRVMDDDERARNINKPFGTAISFYPDVGDNNELWRRIEVDGEVKLDSVQRATVVDQLIEVAKELPSFDLTEAAIKTLKTKWLERIGKMRVYRLRVGDEFRILFVTPHTTEESKTSGTRPMIDETVHVDVQQVPMFTIYAGTTRRIFASKDNKDRPDFKDRTMGIYVNLYDIKSRDKDMMEGGHTVLSKENVLLGEILHLYEQQQASAKEMTKTIRDLEKSEADYDEADFDSQAEAHRIVRGGKGMMDSMGSFTKQTRTKQDAGIVFLVSIFCSVIFWMLGWTMGLLSGG